MNFYEELANIFDEDKVTDETFELESHRLSVYKGNYTTYLKLKEEKNKTLTKNILCRFSYITEMH